MAEVLNSPCRSEPDDEDAQDEVPKDGGFMDTVERRAHKEERKSSSKRYRREKDCLLRDDGWSKTPRRQRLGKNKGRSVRHRAGPRMDKMLPLHLLLSEKRDVEREEEDRAAAEKRCHPPPGGPK